jgi:hypothetical protein
MLFSLFVDDGRREKGEKGEKGAERVECEPMQVDGAATPTMRGSNQRETRRRHWRWRCSNDSPATAAAFSVHGRSVRPHPRHGHEVCLRSPPIEFDSELPPMLLTFVFSSFRLFVCV